MLLPRLVQKTAFEECTNSCRHYPCPHCEQEASEMMKSEDQKVWRSGIMAAIGEQLSGAEVTEMSAELFGLLRVPPMAKTFRR